MNKAGQARSRGAAARATKKRGARAGGAPRKRGTRAGGAQTKRGTRAGGAQTKRATPASGAASRAEAAEALLRPVGVLSSTIKTRAEAPKQGEEGAPDAWLEVYGWAAEALEGLAVGDEILILTWFHRAHRDRMKVHPRSDPKNPLTGVFATRSPDRPNPLGLHPVTVRAIEGRRLRVGPIEAIDGTPVVDIKPVM
jgi:tRNA-Thr(GGU) m(6)t(6)A37 methyltransferase TsaA